MRENEKPPRPPRRTASPPSPAGIAAITRALLFDPRRRRQLMIYIIGAALGLAVVGGTVGFEALKSNLWVFAGYWMVCAFLTLLAVLLAIYDLLMLRLLARRVQRELDARMREEAEEKKGSVD